MGGRERERERERKGERGRERERERARERERERERERVTRQTVSHLSHLPPKITILSERQTALWKSLADTSSPASGRSLDKERNYNKAHSWHSFTNKYM